MSLSRDVSLPLHSHTSYLPYALSLSLPYIPDPLSPSLPSPALTQVAAGGKLVPEECDLSSMASIRSFASRWHSRGERLDVLVCNAGVQFSGDGGRGGPRRCLQIPSLSVGRWMGEVRLLNRIDRQGLAYKPELGGLNPGVMSTRRVLRACIDP